MEYFRRQRIGITLPTAALVLAASAFLTGCGADSNGTPAWTAQPQSGTAAPASASPAASGSPSAEGPTTTSPGSAGGSPSPGATASSWKTYSDPGRKVSFELPREWIAQSVAPDKGSQPGALKIEVKDKAGRYLATLHTGLPRGTAAACAAEAARPYVVVSSVPVDLPASTAEGTIPPRVVFRVIQGYKFFGSYGITNMVGGADGRACTLRNLVQGPEGLGDYYFGDLAALHAFAPDEKVAPAKSFDTLDQAAKYVNEGSEFANVQRMLLSLKVNL